MYWSTIDSQIGLVIFIVHVGNGWNARRKNRHVPIWGFITPYPSKGTIHSGLRLLPFWNFFLALYRSHHFLLKKSEFKVESWAQGFKLDNFTIHSQYFQQCKIIKIESLSSSCLVNFWLFLTKNDDFYLKLKRNSRMAEAWD